MSTFSKMTRLSPERQAELRAWAETMREEPTPTITRYLAEGLLEALDALRDAEQERNKLLDCDPLVTCCSNCDRSHHRICPKIAEAERDEARRQRDGMIERAALELEAWAQDRWQAEVAHRPEQNVHRRTLDGTWKQVERDGPAHLRTALAGEAPATTTLTDRLRAVEGVLATLVTFVSDQPDFHIECGRWIRCRADSALPWKYNPEEPCTCGLTDALAAAEALQAPK